MNKDKLKEQIVTIINNDLANIFDIASVKSISRKLGYVELVTYLNQQNNNYFAFIMCGEDL